jgi:hypothetical protein
MLLSKEPPTRASNRRQVKRLLRRKYRPKRENANTHWSLVRRRLLQGLLRPFVCAGCGTLEFDPIGWTKRRKPLCEACSDPERARL